MADTAVPLKKLTATVIQGFREAVAESVEDDARNIGGLTVRAVSAELAYVVEGIDEESQQPLVRLGVERLSELPAQVISRLTIEIDREAG
jgi:hypothetical protein